MKRRFISAFVIIAILCALLPSCSKKQPDPNTVGVGFGVDSVYQKYGNDIYTADKPLSDIPHTLEAYVYVPQEATENGVIYGNFDNHTNYSLSFSVKNGSPRVYWADRFENTYDILFDEIDVRTGGLVHIAFVNDTAQNRMLCYIDGVLAGSESAPDFDKSVIGPAFSVGGDNRSLNTMYFRGRIKSVAVFSDARSAKQIKSDMKKVKSDDRTLLASYEMAEVDSGGIIYDDSKNGVHLTYSNMWLTESEMSALRNGSFERAFSLAVVGDTQYMSRYNPDKLPILYQWIADNKQAKNIQYVMGLGDITDQDIEQEWDVAKNAISILDGNIEYSLVRGNHDVKNGGELFNDYFASDPDYVTQFERSGGFYESGSVANTYRTLTVGETEFLILSLDYAPGSEVLSWASEVIESHPNHKTIITTHAYLYSDGTRIKAGRKVWEELADLHENVELVLCGHISDNQIMTVSRVGKNGNTVTEMLIDAQDYDRKLEGLGMVAMLYFNADADKFEVEYYSTVLDRYYLSENCFEVDLEAPGENIVYPEWDGSKIKPEGEGTKESPYLISSAANLEWMSASIVATTGKGTFAGVHFKQTNDIDLEGYTLSSIGNYYYASDFDMYAFGGVYDGGGYTIRNGFIRSSADPEAQFTKEYGYGLFGVIYGAVIKNVTLESITVVASGAGGMLVGKAAGNSLETSDADFNSIENCTVKADCKIVPYITTKMSPPEKSTLDDSECAGILGGIVGMSRSATVKDCLCEMNISAFGSFYIVGGIAGSAGYNSRIEGCEYSGTITLTDPPTGEKEHISDTVALESPSDITFDVGDNIIGSLTVVE